MNRSFRRYLKAKRTVDDRALNRRVHRRVADGLRSQGSPLNVLELGAGVGTMIPRILGIVDESATVEYTAVDRDETVLASVPEVLETDPAVEGLATDGAVVEFTFAGRSVRVERVTEDAAVALDRWDRSFDVVIAAAFMDLVDIGDYVPRLLGCLVPGGLAYFPITFDGSTAIEPAIQPALDARILDRYHASMRSRGTDRAGRTLLRELLAARAAIRVVGGGSDWVVIPDGDGYPADEAYFLEYFLETVDHELAGHPDLDADRFAAWIDDRRAQLRDNELALVVHNLDVVAERR